MKHDTYTSSQFGELDTQCYAVPVGAGVISVEIWRNELSNVHVPDVGILPLTCTCVHFGKVHRGECTLRYRTILKSHLSFSGLCNRPK